MDKEKYKIILDTWKDKLVKLYSIDDAVSNNIFIPEDTKKFLLEIGLPILGFEYPFMFLPITHVTPYQHINHHYYIIGDVSILVSGFHLLGIRENSEELFKIFRGEPFFESDKTLMFVNSNITKFVLCLTHYCLFYEKYKPIPLHLINKNELEMEYQKLQECLKKIDEPALLHECFWDYRLGMLVDDFGDVFYPTPD